ncbi:hypothetical protein FIV42_11715 [Persicimonas caeni]|uniref:LTD domain-containing protein n=1 Tax=Persicimonas caeni TaxID=2292766 RepID=A0A4Y6PSS1_PERCE|nr:lamin tail domain-containing protein [Persicimonas caeni]QDG51382.1 hypothetical protein FIV42_11715 [Persicimonas caeni]QED32603.1 hypothetical protein FRD00_11710 [Persicimonas caeni]
MRYCRDATVSPAAGAMRLLALIGLLALTIVGTACSDDEEPPAETTTPQISAFAAEPATITAGEPATLNWTIANATSAEISVVDGDFSHTIADENLASGSLEVTPEATTTYVLTAVNGDKEATAQVEVTVEEPVAAPSVDSFEASPETITEGETATLSWTTTGATSLALVDGDGNDIDLGDADVDSGSVDVSPTADTTYTLTATNDGGSDQQSVTVSVDALPDAPTIDAFSVSPNPAQVGGTVTVSWDVTGADTLTLESDADGAIDISSEPTDTGSIDVTVPDQTDVVYTLTAENAGGTATQDFTLTTGDAVTIASFTADPSDTIVQGDSVTLSWSVANATDVTLESDITGAIDLSNLATPGEISLQPQQTTTYTLTAEGLGGPVTETLTVDVAPPVAITDFSASPQTDVAPGSDVTLSWTVTGATQIDIEDSAANSVYSGTDLTGTVTVTPSADETYTITASNAGSSDTADVTVTVLSAPTINTFGATPDTDVPAGSDVTLSWDVSNAAQVDIVDDAATSIYSGSDATGTVTVNPTADVTYTLTATNANGSDTADVTVTTVAAITIDSFSADTTTTVSGEAVQLSWTTTNGNALTITGDAGITNYTAASGEVASGTLVVRPQTTTIYTLTLDGPGNQQQTSTLTVTVDAANLVISEVLYDVAGSDDTYEWIEVYNAGDTFVDLSNYSMGGGGSDYTYSQLDLSGTLAPQGCAVFGGPASTADNANPTFFDGTGTDIVNDLQNGGSTADGVALFFAPSANVDASSVPIDSVLYGDANSSGLLGEDGSADTELSPDVASGSSLARISPTSDVFVERTSPTPGRCFNATTVSSASAPADTTGTTTIEGFGLDPALDTYELEDDSGTAFVLTNCTETSQDVVECTVPVLTSASSAALDLVITRNLEYTPDADGDPTATPAAQPQEFRLADAYAPSNTINWCNVQFPPTATLTTGGTTIVYGQLYIAGYTDTQSTVFDSPSIVSQLGVGPDNSDPSTATGWSWTDASPNTGFDFSQNNDEYQATLTAPATAGNYDYAYRFSGDGGQTWTYCDSNGPGDGYVPSDAGQLTVN